MLKSHQVVYIGLELVIALLAVAGNILVCWSVCLNSNLQSITNFFVVSLAVADIAVGLLAIPFAITIRYNFLIISFRTGVNVVPQIDYKIQHNVLLVMFAVMAVFLICAIFGLSNISVGFCVDFYGCLFIACFVLVLTQSSIFSLLAIAVDRYIAIKNPLRYNSLVTGTRAKGIITLCWALSVGIGLTPMFGWNTGRNSTIDTTRNNSCPEGMSQCLFEKVVTLDYMVYFNFFGCVLVPLLVMLGIYAHIFMAARRQLRLMSLKVAHTPTPGQRTLSSGSSRTILQREVRAAKSLAIIVGLFAFCWLPLHIINCFNHLCQDCERPHIWVMNIAIILSHANSVVNPFIYAYRIREFRQTFRRILHQHILGQRNGIGSADNRGVGRDSIRRTSHTSKDCSSCGTVVNSYIMDPSLDQTGHKATHEPFCHWTSNLAAVSNSHIPNGHQIKSDTVSAVQEQPDMAVESAMYMGGAVDVLELRGRRNCPTFVNFHAISPKQTDCTCSTNVREVS